MAHLLEILEVTGRKSEPSDGYVVANRVFLDGNALDVPYDLRVKVQASPDQLTTVWVPLLIDRLVVEKRVEVKEEPDGTS